MLLRRRIMKPAEPDTEEYVDLGLPSGLLWAKGNLIKDSNGNYAIGEESDWGTYVSWGNIYGHNEGEGYNFDQTTYDGTPGKQVSADIPPTDTQHDICAASLGAPWHLPTKEDFQELYDNTDSEWVADYNGTGVAGRKFMKKTDHSVYVFFPASGSYNGTSLSYRGTSGYYWSASFYSATSAYGLNFSSSNVRPQYYYYRRFGRSVRPVMQKPYVDLGLPSGKKWAKGNLIKDSNGNYAIGEETDWGTYISWGNIIGHNEGEGYDFSDANYNSTPGKQVSADIPPTDIQHDICAARLGDPWHLPTKEDFQELYDNTDSEWVADYNNTGVAGRKFMKKTDHSVYVFFPASGYYNGTSLSYRGTYGNNWSASFYSATHAYYLYFNSSNVNPQSRSNRRGGRSVRPVQ